MNDEKTQQSYLAQINDIPFGKGLEVVHAEKVYAVFKTDEGFYALDGMCPHAGGPLAQGSLRGNVVTCPWHGWQFNVTTGQHCLNPRVQTSCKLLIEREGKLYFN